MANYGSRHKRTPFPHVAFETLSDAHIQPPLQYAPSGEVLRSHHLANLGATRKSGRVVNVWMSIGASGKDDANPLAISGEVYINGTTCLSTVPTIEHVSGEASQQKTTKTTGDTGITQAVVDQDANTFTEGDVLTCDVICDRTASPTTEMNSVCLVVEVEPFMASPND